MRTELLEKINPGREYFLNEVLELELIPNIKSYSALYNLITEKEDDGWKTTRTLVKETGQGKLYATHEGHPWSKINGKIKIKGEQIVVFLKINGLLDD